jgi:murein L,D-transpeptidase YafK
LDAPGRRTVAQRLEQFGPAVDRRLSAAFEAAGLPYPPEEVALLAFKDSKTLEVYARQTGQAWRFVKAYPVLAASGEPGPKLNEGDRQVPEGLYTIELLNPNSRFHVSLRLNYPNDFDRRMAQADGRTDLGGDIMIHGQASSVGCLAVGDEPAEDLFVLTALVGKERVRVLMSPTDFRKPDAVEPSSSLAWAEALYAEIRQALRDFSRP